MPEDVDILNSLVDPRLVAVGVIFCAIASIVLLVFYIPRLNYLKYLEEKLSETRSQRDYAYDQWSVSLLQGSNNKKEFNKFVETIEAEHQEELRVEKAKTKRAENKAKAFAKAVDNARGVA